MVAGGLSRPILLFLRRSWDRDHLRPPNALALSTSTSPERTKCVSVATIKTTPLNIRVITPINRYENCSRRKRKANPRTNIRDDDLHIAGKD